MRWSLNPSDNWHSIVFGLLFLAGLIWTVSLFFNSPGTPVQDEVAHVLISRNAWRYPVLILDIWGRPVNTLLYMIPSLGGLAGARWFSIVLAGLTVVVTSQAARHLGARWWFVVPAFLWFQPWFNDLSYTAITEVPFSLLLIVGILMWLRHHVLAATLAIGLLPLVRYEAIALVLVWCLYVVYRREWRAAILCWSPVIVYNLVYYAAAQRWPAAIYLSPKPTFLYGSGTLLHFVEPVVQNAGIPLIILSAFSAIAILKDGSKRFVAVWYVLYFLIHTVLYHFGLYASGGYYLFLLPLAPAIAIASALGIEALLDLPSRIAVRHISRPHVLPLLTGLALTLILASVIAVGLRSRPHLLDLEATALREAADWIRQNGLAGYPVIATHVWFYYFYDLSWVPTQGWAQPPPLAGISRGSLVLWDGHYSDRWGMTYDELSTPDSGWAELKAFGDRFAVVFQKTSD